MDDEPQREPTNEESVARAAVLTGAFVVLAAVITGLALTQVALAVASDAQRFTTEVGLALACAAAGTATAVRGGLQLMSAGSDAGGGDRTPGPGSMA